MTRNELDRLKEWFLNYASSFYTDDPAYNFAIKMKEDHTFRVCDTIIMIAEKLGLSGHDVMLAETMALFHDLGRFEQYRMYGTFRDMDSENHASLGLKEMAAHDVLHMCAKDEKKTIIKAISFHNTIKAPDTEPGRILFFIRLLRDADKLDIWTLFSDKIHENNGRLDKTISLGLPDEPGFSDVVISTLARKEIVRMEDLRTFNDFKLLQIGWVYDLNFAPSFEALLRLKIIEKISATLPVSEKITDAVNQAMAYSKSIISSTPRQ